MCLFPKLILNKKYLPNKKNRFNPPVLKDERIRYVAAACGKCSECLQKKAKGWKIRLFNEYKVNTECIFVTLTFSDDAIINIINNHLINYDDDDNNIFINITTDNIDIKQLNNEQLNKIASKAVRLFLERYRKKYKKSIKHFLITELGGLNGRIHLHGLLFKKIDKDELSNLWKYGYVYIGEYVNDKTINYVCKYITKFDSDYIPIILCSKGIGEDAINNKELLHYTRYNGKETKDYYKLPDGKRVSLPVYYRNKLYDEETREYIWINRLDRKEIFIKGIKFSLNTDNDYTNYIKTLEYYQRKEKEIRKIDTTNKTYYKILKKLNNPKPKNA